MPRRGRSEPISAALAGPGPAFLGTLRTGHCRDAGGSDRAWSSGPADWGPVSREGSRRARACRPRGCRVAAKLAGGVPLSSDLRQHPVNLFRPAAFRKLDLRRGRGLLLSPSTERAPDKCCRRPHGRKGHGFPPLAGPPPAQVAEGGIAQAGSTSVRAGGFDRPLNKLEVMAYAPRGWGRRWWGMPHFRGPVRGST